MWIYLKTAAFAILLCLLASCGAPSQSTRKGPTAYGNRISHVRTTAYTHTESGGGRNALGKNLSCRGHISAAADWSRFPVGTRFQIIGSGESYVIDDYGGALVGTNTI